MARCGSFAELQIHPPSVPLTYKKTDGNTVDMGGYDKNEKGGVGMNHFSSLEEVGIFLVASC